MELLQLKYFYALAQTQHVTKTAQQLHIAQPALTQIIHRLEKELGVKLFRTSGRNIVLTEYGEYLKNKTEPVLKALNEIPEELRTLAGERRNLLKINVLAASKLITDTIIEFQKQHKDIRFHVVQNSRTEDSDITIFTMEFFRRPKNTKNKFHIFTEQIFLAVPKESVYSDKSDVKLCDISREKFIALAESVGLRSICDRFCIQAGFKPDVIFESDNPTAVKNLIGANIGVGFWPQYTWDSLDEDNIKLIPISEPKCRRDIVVQLNATACGHDEAILYFEYLTEFFDNLKE